MRDLSAGADLPEEGRAAGGLLSLARLDVTDPAQFEFPADLQVLVNNAGVRHFYLPVEETPLDGWREVFETNVFGAVEVTRLAIPHLRASGGVICNITSASNLTPWPFTAAYRASKWALSALSETLRTELAPLGVRVIEVLPGPIDTELLATSVIHRLPEAALFPAYRPMAERNFPVGSSPDRPITPPTEAARAIANAILDDDGPMRYGCDAVSVKALEDWRGRTDEEGMRGALTRLLGDS
jgi:NAD(P)-dependent dehydrogenase (short-subunit alcohol dehydrogenase family)